MSLSKPGLKRKQFYMKAKIKIIQVVRQSSVKKGKINKTQFALKHGLAKSSLQTISASKSQQCMNTAETYGNAIEGRVKFPYWHTVSLSTKQGQTRWKFIGLANKGRGVGQGLRSVEVQRPHILMKCLPITITYTKVNPTGIGIFFMSVHYSFNSNTIAFVNLNYYIKINNGIVTINNLRRNYKQLNRKYQRLSRNYYNNCV